MMTKLTHGELFAGISGFGLGFEKNGVKTVWSVEIDKACQSIIRRHHPDIDIFDDVREVGAHNLKPVDIITFGSPCQDLSIAGRRKGLNGNRSGLFFEAARIIRELEPKWAIWENVPGALSSNKGADFRAVLEELLNADIPMPRSGRWASAGMVRSGHTEIAWRTLDAQYFGLAQRRRRVFLIVGFGDRSPSEVLFEREGGARNTAPRRETKTRASSATTRSITDNSNQQLPINEVGYALCASKTATGRLDPNGQDFVIAGIAGYKQGQKGTLRSSGGDVGGGSEILITGTLDRKSCSSNRGSQANEHEFLVPVAFDWQSGGDVRLGLSDKPMLQSYQTPAIAWQNRQQSGEIRIQIDTLPSDTRQWGTGGNNVPMIGVRRLTPVECERLQGFDDGWTDGQSDSARYRQLGNAVAVPVVAWISNRLLSISCMTCQNEQTPTSKTS